MDSLANAISPNEVVLNIVKIHFKLRVSLDFSTHQQFPRQRQKIVADCIIAIFVMATTSRHRGPIFTVSLVSKRKRCRVLNKVWNIYAF